MVGSFAYTSKIRDSGTYLPVLENRVKARRTAISLSNLTKTRCTSYLALCKDFARARTFELTSPTGSFRLANKEFQMMEVFLCNQGHSITHKRLLEKIWGDEKQVQTNVVWMYISYLRKKLEALHANLQITEASHAEYILEVGG